MYENTLAASQRPPAEQQDDLHYAIIHLCPNQEEALYSNIRPPQSHRQIEEEEEEDGVEYTTVKTDNSSSAPGWAANFF